MSYILLLIINLIVIFIVWVILNSKIKKNSIPSRIEEYTREVERLIIELNRALEDVVSISEDRIEELKSLIKKAEKVIKKSKVSSKKSLNILSEGDSGFTNKKEKNPVVIKSDENKKIEAKQDKKKMIDKKNKNDNQIKIEKGSLIEKTGHLISMGYSREEIAEILGITPVEVDFLKSLSIRKA